MPKHQSYLTLQNYLPKKKSKILNTKTVNSNEAINIAETVTTSLPKINKWKPDNTLAIKGSKKQMPLSLYGLNILITNKTIHATVSKEDKNGVNNA